MSRLLLLPVCFLLAGCVASPPEKPVSYSYKDESWIPISIWGVAHGFLPPEEMSLAPLEMTATNGYAWNGLNLKAKTSLIPLPTFVLQSGTGRLLLQAQTRRAYWDDTLFPLGFAPKYLQGQLLVNRLDLDKSILPLALLNDDPLPTNRVVVLDPGMAAGAQGGDDYTLDWAQRLSSLLQRQGWKVIMTRTNEQKQSLESREFTADSCHAGVFLNLDFDTNSFDSSVGGVETYCLPPVGMPSSGPANPQEITWRAFPNNSFDILNWQYAFRVQRALSRIPDVVDGGLQRSRAMPILQNRPCPALRICGGYLSNEHDRRLIANPEFRQRLAEAMAAALR